MLAVAAWHAGHAAHNSIETYKQRVGSFVKRRKEEGKGLPAGQGVATCQFPAFHCLLAWAEERFFYAHMVRYLIFALTLPTFNCICDL